MTKKAKSAREVAEEFGGVHRIPKPVEEDLGDTVVSAIYGWTAKTWAKRVETGIREKKLTATQSEVVAFFERLTEFEEAKKAIQEKRGTKALRSKFLTAYQNLFEATETLNIETAMSKSDYL